MWEYKATRFLPKFQEEVTLDTKLKSLEEMLDFYGRKNWELVALDIEEPFAIFKRQALELSEKQILDAVRRTVRA